MSHELCPERPLFGGAISSLPSKFCCYFVFHQEHDFFRMRVISDKFPDHQEVFVDPSRDESLIFELLNFKTEVGDNGSASWFLDYLVREQDAEGFKLIEQSEIIEASGLSFRNIPTVVTTSVGEMAISKGRQEREAQNLVRPSGLAVPASQSGIMPMCDVIKQSLSTFKVNDWSLFGSST